MTFLLQRDFFFIPDYHMQRLSTRTFERLDKEYTQCNTQIDKILIL